MRRLWAEEAGREPRVLGVFWANLLGREMTERLGGLTHIRDGSQPLFEETGLPLLRAAADRGVIVLLSQRITDFMYPHLGITWRQFDRAGWLHRRLATAGLLAGRE